MEEKQTHVKPPCLTRTNSAPDEGANMIGKVNWTWVLQMCVNESVYLYYIIYSLSLKSLIK